MTLLKIAVTVGGLIFILTQIDLGDAVAQLLRADLRWAAAALLLVMSSLVLRAYRWLPCCAAWGSICPSPASSASFYGPLL